MLRHHTRSHALALALVAQCLGCAPRAQSGVEPVVEAAVPAVVTGASLLEGAAATARVEVLETGTRLLHYAGNPTPGSVIANALVLSVSSADSVTELESARRHIESLGIAGLTVDHTPGSKVMLVRVAVPEVLAPGDVLALLRLPPALRVKAQPNVLMRMDSNQNLLNPVWFDPQVEQWALDNRGEFGYDSTAADADADGAEALVRMLHTGIPASTSVVMIMDSGVNQYHPALAGALWTNADEVPENGRDDDGNGYVDDVHGWDFAANSPVLVDENGHGTHVAGIVAARPGGTYGIAPHSRIMIAKISVKGTGSTSLLAASRAVEYAVAKRADVVNMSFSSDVDLLAFRDGIWAAALRDSTMFVASAGNDGLDLQQHPKYPCAYGLLTCVASTSALDSLSTFSNYGGWAQGNYFIAVAAPGEFINSTKYYTYEPLSGTSMAAPLVAGTFAALKSMYPWESSTDRRRRVYANADRLPHLEGKVQNGRRLNIYHAMFSRVDTALVEGTSGTAWCEAAINTSSGPVKRRENRPYANSGEPNVDGSNLQRAFRICTARQLPGSWTGTPPASSAWRSTSSGTRCSTRFTARSATTVRRRCSSASCMATASQSATCG